jgi:hypothetical protein
MCTQAIVTNAWFCVSNIFFKNKKLQMELLLHNVIFNALVYEINIMNDKYPKAL